MASIPQSRGRGIGVYFAASLTRERYNTIRTNAAMRQDYAVASGSAVSLWTGWKVAQSLVRSHISVASLRRQRQHTETLPSIENSYRCTLEHVHIRLPAPTHKTGDEHLHGTRRQSSQWYVLMMVWPRYEHLCGSRNQIMVCLIKLERRRPPQPTPSCSQPVLFTCETLADI